MAAFTDALENVLLDQFLKTGGAAPAWWTSHLAAGTGNVWLALFTVATTDALTTGGGGQGEVTGGSYARVQLVGGSQMSVAASGSSNNVGQITFPQATANWGTITHVAIFTASTGQMALVHGPLATPKTVNNGDTFRVLTSQLVIALS